MGCGEGSHRAEMVTTRLARGSPPSRSVGGHAPLPGPNDDQRRGCASSPGARRAHRGRARRRGSSSPRPGRPRARRLAGSLLVWAVDSEIPRRRSRTARRLMGAAKSGAWAEPPERTQPEVSGVAGAKGVSVDEDRTLAAVELPHEAVPVESSPRALLEPGPNGASRFPGTRCTSIPRRTSRSRASRTRTEPPGWPPAADPHVEQVAEADQAGPPRAGRRAERAPGALVKGRLGLNP